MSVVFPASMCAMMPMFLTLSSDYSADILFFPTSLRATRATVAATGACPCPLCGRSVPVLGDCCNAPPGCLFYHL